MRYALSPSDGSGARVHVITIGEIENFASTTGNFNTTAQFGFAPLSVITYLCSSFTNQVLAQLGLLKY